MEKLAGAPLLHDVGPEEIVARSEFMEKREYKHYFVNLGYPDRSQKPSEQ